MGGTFACPECGCEIRPVGLSPGREVRCDWCRSMVEVPFLPRADQIKRLRHDRDVKRSRRATRLWITIGLSALGLLLVIVAASRAFRSHQRSSRDETTSQLVEVARRAERAGRLDEALVALESAVAMAGPGDDGSVSLTSLRQQRAALARREAESQLIVLEGSKGASGDDPDRAVGRALTLKARVARDPALEGLGDRVEAVLEPLRLRRIEADAAAARAAEASGRAAEAYEAARHALAHADELPTPLRRQWQAEADAIAARIIGRFGAVLAPVRGHYALGSASSYEEALHPLCAEALRNAGYLPRPKGKEWDNLWSSVAPYRLEFEVTERQTDAYLESPNRITRLEAVVSYFRRGERLWYISPNVGTSVPIPGAPAYLASRLASAGRRSVEFERLFYDNARANLRERLGNYLKNLPALSGGDAGAARAPASPSPND